MNILICSVGRRVQLVDYFRKELNKEEGKLIAIDCDPTAPALYKADYFEIAPRIDQPEYISHIKEICYKHNVKAIISLIDPELTLLANHKEELERENIEVIVSDKKIVDICYDKYLTYQFLKGNGLPLVPTYIDLELVLQDLTNEKLHFPLIAKPRNGSASIGVKKITTFEELQGYWQEYKNLIIQPFMEGDEYCAECYVDTFTREITHFFSKRKINMRAGETDKSVVIKDSNLVNIIDKLIKTLNPIGPVDVDLFRTSEGYVISEINPRFGGGYPYAYEMGQNFITAIMNNLNGIPNARLEKYTGPYVEGRIMVRYDQFIVL